MDVRESFMFVKVLREVSRITRFAGVRVTLRYLYAMAQHHREIVQTGRLTAADLEMSRHDYAVRVLKTTVLIPGNCFGLARELYGKQPYFRQKGFRIRPGDIVVDLGANCGLFSIPASKIGARVFAIEAQSGFVEDFQEIARRNNVADRIFVELGIVSGKRGAFSDARVLESSSRWEGKQPPALSVKEIVDKYHLPRVDFLKVDIEGSEFGLFGEDSAILTRIGRVAMEVHLDYGSVSEVVEPLKIAGFETALLSPDLLSVEELKGSGGYLFAWRN
jgi:FkbM family methyltransferase